MFIFRDSRILSKKSKTCIYKGFDSAILETENPCNIRLPGIGGDRVQKDRKKYIFDPRIQGRNCLFCKERYKVRRNHWPDEKGIVTYSAHNMEGGN